MKHTEYFRTFLKEQVNPDQTRLKRLRNSVGAVTDYLHGNLDGYLGFRHQGSFPLQTMTRPVNGTGYDADVQILMAYDSPSAVDYIQAVYDCLMKHGTYQQMSNRHTRCVKLDYAGEFSMDIVPCVTRLDECQYVCNRQDNRFEITDGAGYRDWFNDRSRITSGNLKRVTRLLKYLRDHKGNFSVKSILLTTLVGNIVKGDWDQDRFSSLPDALKAMSNDINVYLQDRVSMPIVRNPVLYVEDFNRHWDERSYANFRKLFGIYNEKINRAYSEPDHNRSVRLWRELFGDTFGKLQPDAASGGSTTVRPRKPWLP